MNLTASCKWCFCRFSGVLNPSLVLHYWLDVTLVVKSSYTPENLRKLPFSDAVNYTTLRLTWRLNNEATSEFDSGAQKTYESTPLMTQSTTRRDSDINTTIVRVTCRLINEATLNLNSAPQKSYESTPFTTHSTTGRDFDIKTTTYQQCDSRFEMSTRKNNFSPNICFIILNRWRVVSCHRVFGSFCPLWCPRTRGYALSKPATRLLRLLCWKTPPNFRDLA